MGAVQPNIVVILCDQLRRQALSCYGDPNVRSEHIDALAERGVRFGAACASYPVCVPFRFSMLTGEYAHSRQVPAINWRMSPSERTLADIFNDVGYHTAYIGKWHLFGGAGPGMYKRPVPREFQGRFQKWFGFEFRNDFFDSVYFEDASDTPIPIDGYQTDGLFDCAIRYLHDRPSVQQPFFCMLSVEAPHPPLDAPQSYLKQWADRELQLPPNFMTATHHPPAHTRTFTDAAARERAIDDMRRYYAMIQNLDDNVGRLTAALDHSGLADNTIVVFLSDHGEMMGSHGVRAKQMPYEESTGIPLIVAGPPDRVSQGRTVAEPVATEDLFPTLCGLANVPVPDGLPGANAAPLVRNTDASLDRPGIMLEFVAELRPGMPLCGCTYRGFRSKRYKYTVFGEPGQAMKPWQCFDLEQDPYELHNRIDNPAMFEVIRRHHRWLRERMSETDDHAWLDAAYGCESLNAWQTVSS